VGRLFGLPAAERAGRAKDLLARVGLADVARRRIGGFSRGMRQRLGLAQALMNRPEVLFLDEPVSALDPLGRKDVLELIDRLRGECTIFMSTHILADVERVCDTVGIIARGKLITQAPREALLAQYAQPVFELEAEPGGEAALAEWVKGLAAEPWVRAVALSAGVARVTVSDAATGRRALLPAAAGSGLGLVRYEMLRPSLEDVFLQLVDPSNGKAPA
jgi:ABC-2 type transport system ATP-binding protein